MSRSASRGQDATAAPLLIVKACFIGEISFCLAQVPEKSRKTSFQRLPCLHPACAAEICEMQAFNAASLSNVTGE